MTVEKITRVLRSLLVFSCVYTKQYCLVCVSMLEPINSTKGNLGTIKSWTEAQASICTTYFDPWLVSGTRHVCKIWLLSERVKIEAKFRISVLRPVH